MSAVAAPLQAVPAPPKSSSSSAAGQRRRAQPASGGGVYESLFSGGQPLPVGLRRTLEVRFGNADFGGVRLHDDARSDRAAREHGARAFTLGQHIHFAARQYRPQQAEGLHLLAHELTHTVQQRGAVAAGPHAIGPAGSLHERQADAVADAVASGVPLREGFSFSAAPMLIQRVPGPGDPDPIRDSACWMHFKKGTTEFVDAKQFAGCLKLVLGIVNKKDGPAQDIALWGFASEEGPPDFNQKLSKQRADIVMLLMKQGGVPAARLSALGQGVSTFYKTPEENRRVEIIVSTSVTLEKDKVEVKPQPKKKGVCGPDVSAQMGGGIAELRKSFAALGDDRKAESCDELADPVQGLFGWDFPRLHVRGWLADYRPACATQLASPGEACCANSVQVDGECHYAGSANYVIFGTMCRQCFDHYTAKGDLSALSNFSEKAMLSRIDMYKGPYSLLGAGANFKASQRWASAGFAGWPGGGSPPAGDCSKDCSPTCETPFKSKTGVDDKAFRSRWCPHIDPVGGCQGKGANAKQLGGMLWNKLTK